MSLTPVIICEYIIAGDFEFEMVSMVCAGAERKTIHEKNLKSKISCNTLFKIKSALSTKKEHFRQAYRDFRTSYFSNKTISHDFKVENFS